MLHVVIKGSKKNATRAAARRGIVVKHCRLDKDWQATTLCDVPCQTGVKIKLADWLKEASTWRNRRGNAPGVLLFVSGSCKR